MTFGRSWDTDSGATRAWPGMGRGAVGRPGAGRGPGPGAVRATAVAGRDLRDDAAGAAARAPGPRGDVRAAILDVLAVEPLNGYQVIQQIAERTGGPWRPSPGSVYPTICQLEDEGLIISDEERGRTLRLTSEGEAYVAEHPDELGAVWTAFDAEPVEDGPDLSVLKSETGQLMSALWQIISTGTDEQRKDAMAVLIETRRKLYGLLADEDPR